VRPASSWISGLENAHNGGGGSGGKVVVRRLFIPNGGEGMESATTGRIEETITVRDMVSKINEKEKDQNRLVKNNRGELPPGLR